MLADADISDSRALEFVTLCSTFGPAIASAMRPNFGPSLAHSLILKAAARVTPSEGDRRTSPSCGCLYVPGLLE